MFNIFKKQSSPSRADFMSTIPTKNQLITEKKTATSLTLTAPLRPHTLKPLTPTKEKSFELDDLGTFVWNSIDNQRTVEQLIRHFAHSQHVNLRESEVAITTFLKTLAQRNLIALAVQ